MDHLTDPMDVACNNLDAESISKLVNLCSSMKEYAYSPYSRFPVGAALLCEDGTVYTGCNVENGSLQLVICAERTAVVKAISEGRRRFRAIFIASDLKDDFIVPCGACRQFLTEFGTDWDVYMTKPNGTYLRRTVDQLLPGSVTPTAMLGRMRENCCASAEKGSYVSVSSGPPRKEPTQEVIES